MALELAELLEIEFGEVPERVRWWEPIGLCRKVNQFSPAEQFGMMMAHRINRAKSRQQMTKGLQVWHYADRYRYMWR